MKYCYDKKITIMNRQIMGGKIEKYTDNKIKSKQKKMSDEVNIKLFENDNYKILYNDINYKINEINPLLEIKRGELMNVIYNQYNTTVLKYIDRKHIESKFHTAEQNLETQLARYVMYLLSKGNYIDPLIPVAEKNHINLFNDLKNKINDANSINKALDEMNINKKFNDAFDELYNYFNSKDYNDSKHNYNIVIHHKNNIIIMNVIINSKIIDSIELNSELYNKIIKKYIPQDSISLISSNTLIYCLVKRYKILKSFNQQLAVEEKILIDVKNKHKINFELFGSAINTVLDNYCSLFYDIEKYFGSLGSAFDTTIIKGGFTINPPFDENIMTDIIDKFLNEMKNSKERIYAYVWIPVWDKHGQEILYKRNNITFRNKDYGTYKPIELLDKSKNIVSKDILSINNIKFFNYTTFKFVNATNMYKIMLDNQITR